MQKNSIHYLIGTGLLAVAILVAAFLYVPSAYATPPKITVSKYTYMYYDPKGIYTNSDGLHYGYRSGYLGWFLRDGTIYFQGMSCNLQPGQAPFENYAAYKDHSQPGCYYEYGVELDYPFFLYGQAVLPSPQ